MHCHYTLERSGDESHLVAHSWLSKNELQTLFHSRWPLQLSQTCLTHRNKHKHNTSFHEMASVASQLIEEVTAHVQRDSLEDAREICADGTY